MKKYIINELRKCSRVPGKQKTWIATELSDEQLYQLYKKLSNGEKAKSIARYVQENWNIKSNSTVHSISQGILKFKKRISLMLQDEKFVDTLSRQPYVPVSNSPMGTLKTNELIAQNLRWRIQNIIKEELETGVKYPYLARDVQALTSFERIIVKQRDWLLKHPDDDPLKEYEMKSRDRELERQFNIVMETSTEDSRKAMIEALDRWLELCEENALTLEIGPDGKKTLKK